MPSTHLLHFTFKVWENVVLRIWFAYESFKNQFIFLKEYKRYHFIFKSSFFFMSANVVLTAAIVKNCQSIRINEILSTSDQRSGFDFFSHLAKIHLNIVIDLLSVVIQITFKSVYNYLYYQTINSRNHNYWCNRCACTLFISQNVKHHKLYLDCFISNLTLFDQ